MNKNYLIYIILISLIIITFYLYQRESMANDTECYQSKIKENVNKLIVLANTIQDNEITINGNLSVTDKINVSNNIFVDKSNLIVKNGAIYIGDKEWAILIDPDNPNNLQIASIGVAGFPDTFAKLSFNNNELELLNVSSMESSNVVTGTLKTDNLIINNIDSNQGQFNNLSSKNGKFDKLITQNIGQDSYQMSSRTNQNRCGDPRDSQPIGNWSDIEKSDCYQSCPPDTVISGIRAGNEWNHKHPFCKKLN